MRIEIDTKELDKKLEAALMAFALEFAGKLADAAPADTGELRAAIRNGYSVKRDGTGWLISFNMPIHAAYIEFGTGIYGPKGTPIVPRVKKTLAWEAGVKYRGKYGSMHEFSGSKNWYAFKWVRGIHPMPFIRPTFHQHYVSTLERNLRRFVK